MRKGKEKKNRRNSEEGWRGEDWVKRWRVLLGAPVPEVKEHRQKH